jgi:hypothetical protein
MAAAMSGVKCGRLLIQSAAVRYEDKRSHTTKTIFSQRLASFHCKAGDSGAPVYHGSTAIGIVAATSAPGCFYTHIGHALHDLHDLTLATD